MKNKINELIEKQMRSQYATNQGRDMHRKMQNVFFNSGVWTGDDNIVLHIKNIPGLCEWLGPLSRTEIPVAGMVENKFISRRIDRLYVNNDDKTVVVLDYKTDIDKNFFHEKYIEQLTEYYALLKQIYKNFDIQCKILWLNDFTLENVQIKDII